MALVHRLQQLTGAPVAAIFGERLPHGAGYRGHLRIINDGGMLPEDPAEAAAVINRTIEELVAIAPTQYLWSYNRYKTPSGMERPPRALPATESSHS